ncbi:MAG: peptide chain release factor-like protein [Planctomycetia bacterium]|nr:peptide chain release factor-like protein [Planctomycetia bacterium]
MSAIHPASLPEAQLLKDCTERRTRRSGPGGQHRNKVETAVILKHEPTGVEAEANECRSQAENRSEAVFRLRVRLALTVRTEQPPVPSTSELWQSRCRNGRISINPHHDDFPAILAEALDILAANSFEVPLAAKTLGCSATQLVKLLKDEPKAFQLLNQERTDRGLSHLR